MERIKQSIPDAVLRTTFIVGFPGETDEQFEHLVSFVKRHEFDHVGVFTFSPEEETPAYQMSQHIPPEIAQERREILMQVQQPISLKKNQGCVGEIVNVLIEQENPQTEALIGRSARFAPDVDGLVYVQGEAPLNSIVPIKITHADTYDLYGEVIQTQDVLEINA
jgi:ribosomal protein S12 methylthiotransferase